MDRYKEVEISDKSEKIGGTRFDLEVHSKDTERKSSERCHNSNQCKLAP